jgi:putative flippase GtrA
MAYSRGMLWLIQTLIWVLPGPVRRRIPPGSIALLAQFMQFGAVGIIGFVADTAVVYALRAPTGLYVAGALAYVVAVTVTWWVNRIWTFRHTVDAGRMRHQWVRYAIANLPGLLLNLGTYFALVAGSPFCAAYPVVAVAAGAVAGMFANFTLSRSLVFR